MAKDNVDFTRKELEDVLPDYTILDDVLSGERKFKIDAVKKGYIRTLNPADTDEYNLLLNKYYLDGATLFPYALNTLNGLSQMVFNKMPKIELEDELSYLKTNATGSGVGILQLHKRVVRELLKKGRVVLWVDATVNVDKSAAAKPYAFINMRQAESVRNWRDDVNGISLTVFKEKKTIYGTFSQETKDIWRVLMLVNGVYVSQVWEKTQDGFKPTSEQVAPTDFNGNLWDQIPVVFAGAENNDTEIDMPPLLEIVNLNIKHFKNSADYEHAVFYAGQPQPYMSGLDQHWLDTVINNLDEDGSKGEDAFQMGSSRVLALPDGGVFGFAQAEPNTLPKEAMEHKEDNFIKLGAKLIQKGSGNTKIEAGQNAASETSVLANVAINSEDAINKAIGFVQRFMIKNPRDGASYVELNKEFINRELTAQEITAIVMAWNNKALTDTGMVKMWQRYNMEDPNKSVEELIEELQANSSGLGLNG